MSRLYFLILSIFLAVIISCDKAVFTGTPEGPPSHDGKIFIQSKPSNAVIYLNKKNMGIKTPDTLKWIPNGNQLITLKLPLYEDTSFNVTTVDGQTKNIFINFSLNSKNVGKIYVSSQPTGADIWLNDSLTNKKTPFTFSKLVPGNYKIKCAYSLCRPDSINVTVSSSTTVNAYLTLEDTSKWVSYNTKNAPLVSDHVFALACDKSDLTWIGTDQGLMSFSGQTWKVYNENNSALQSNYINCLAVDNQNRKWIGTSNGLYVYDGMTWTNYSTNLPDQHVTAIIFDKMNNVWIGTYGGLVRFSNGTWTAYNTNNSGLRENMVINLAVDDLNRIWVGSVHNYISIYNGTGWSYYDNTNISSEIKGIGSDAPIVQSMVEDKSGKIWICFFYPKTSRSVLIYWNGTEWTVFSDREFLFNYTITLYTKENYLLFGNNYSLSVLDYASGLFTSYHEANSALSLFKIQTVTTDNDNNIWVGTLFNGIGKFKNGNF